MHEPLIDLIIPVWNHPVETRDCLVSLVNHSPATARFILVDNGSERETQRILQEFAEGLDQRALLICNDVNQGFVKAVNRGLERSEARYIAVVRNSTTVSAGWLEPLLHAFEGDLPAGIAVPWLVDRNGGRTKGGAKPLELENGSFAAMLLLRRMYETIGGFDEELDGGLWCLRDYSRRAGRAGFLTVRAPGGAVFYEEEVRLGSEARREATLKRSIDLFRERWGEGCRYSVLFPKGIDSAPLKGMFAGMLAAARLGHRFEALLPHGLRKKAEHAGFRLPHENIRIHDLPLFLTEGRLKKIQEGLEADFPGIIAVNAGEAKPDPAPGKVISFGEMLTRTGG